MYYILDNDKIVLFDEDRQRLENTIKFMPQYKTLDILETDRDIKEFMFVDSEEYKEAQHKKVLELRMTPLDFLKALETLGVSYETVKGILEANPLVEREMRYCQFVYRKHPMIEQFATQYGITSEQLDEMFIQANKEN